METTGRCDREALAALAAGELAGPERQAVLDHLRGCARCQEQLRWLQRVDRLLGGGTPAGHPSAAALTAYAASELCGRGGRAHAQLAAHLGQCVACQVLERAARAGLEEAARLEHGLQLLEPQTAERAAPCAPLALLVPVELLVPIPAPPAAILAAPAEPAAPEWADRRVLLEEPHLRLVYFREGGHGHVGLFADPAAIAELTCTLDGATLAAVHEPEGVIFDLGPAFALPGRALLLRFTLAGTPRAVRCTLVEA